MTFVRILTQRQTTEKTNYIGTAKDQYQGDGNGYQIANIIDKATQRQYSLFGYTSCAGPKGIAESHQLYDAAYNARLNNNKEKISKGRTKLNPSLPLHAGKTFTNIEIKKLESDRVNQYSSSRNPINPNSRLPENIFNITSIKNNLPVEDNRLDISLLESFKKNPLTQSLQSYA